jgi:hypothetical protein
MKFKIYFSFALLAIVAVMFTGCVKEGPVGPAGLDGINADVITSPWYTPTSWIYDSKGGEYYFDVTNSAITKDVVESGIILAYASIPGDVYNDYTVRALPAYAVGADWDFLLPNDGGSSYGVIEFTTDKTSRPGTSGYNFRFIIVPSISSLKSGKLKSTSASDLKKMSYHDVCTLLGIQE